ncbi:sensor histidine kinase [Sphingomonas pokkalii]|uniref:histidine kinase n=1 Tax=Sphingomonas pokkalii TaxID=2175090 RepID=A0A2U0SBV5_9SPHN|nr:HAMP domain-containing sensor histidine kinase [Sphingomonas pokkalii]PVX28858.1 ATP-binding protein [Sphingomonas pokkalii]
MASSRTRTAITLALLLAMAGAAAGAAGARGLWLALTGALLGVAWLTVLIVLALRQPPPITPPPACRAEREASVHRLLLDASPTPLLLIDGSVVRTLNRAARRLFDTDDRVMPPPLPLLDRAASHLRHAGRSWRADRVEVGAQVVVALVDVESEERTAEARASAEMIQVLGHELLNGLLPIVALAESGVTAVAAQARDPGLLAEILTTLARRAESLQRFTEAYRSLARLPPPMAQEISVTELIGDLARLFVGRWPDALLSIDVSEHLSARCDRDQLNQAIWALLQNAVEAAGVGSAPPSVHLSASADGAALTIDVVDNGPGVPVEQARAIFRPFTTTKPAGTGIGLSLARQIAQAHGGTLVMLSVPATTFRLQIPLQMKAGLA